MPASLQRGLRISSLWPHPCVEAVSLVKFDFRLACLSTYRHADRNRLPLLLLQTIEAAIYGGRAVRKLVKRLLQLVQWVGIVALAQPRRLIRRPGRGCCFTCHGVVSGHELLRWREDEARNSTCHCAAAGGTAAVDRV